MGDRLLVRTNVLVCIVVAIGFVLTAFLGYRANYSAFMQDIEQVSLLASEDIYYQQKAFFERPVSVSLAMAGDKLLAEKLSEETGDEKADAALVDGLASYLAQYQRDHGFDSVFLVSAATGRYYCPAGVDRVIAEGDAENDWFFDFMEDDASSNLVVDNDQVVGADDEVTVFVNCKVLGTDGRVLGVVGVGFRAGFLQEVLGRYRSQFDVEASLVEPDGTLAASPDHTGFDGTNLFSLRSYDEHVRSAVLEDGVDGEARSFWAEDGDRSVFVVARDVPGLDWKLVVERDSSEVVAQMRARAVESTVVIVAIILAILVVITCSIRGFRKRIVDLTRTLDEQRKTLFEQATNELFEDVYDLDVTRNRPANEATARYFESHGSPPGAPFDQALRAVAACQVKEEYRQGYIDTFHPEHVLQAFSEGVDTLRYELMISDGADGWYWMRITGLIVQSEDGSVHLLSYRQNIDAEKERERRLLDRVETDEMTGLLNKTATQRRIEEELARADGQEGETFHALFILDIDRFKTANDDHGHRFGDRVIVSFADGLREQFGERGIVGRVGGDEFAAFVPAPSAAWAARKAEVLVRAFDRTVEEGGRTWKMTSSIGVAVAPRDGSDFETLFGHADEALYEAKRKGRNGFAVHGG